jgi:hypothetical protein
MLVQKTVAVAAGATVNNVLAGLTIERAPWDAKAEIAVVADSANFLCDVVSGTDVLMENSNPSIANRVPIYPDDFTLEDVIPAGELLQVRVRNTDAANPHTVYVAVKLTPIA